MTKGEAKRKLAKLMADAEHVRPMSPPDHSPEVYEMLRKVDRAFKAYRKAARSVSRCRTAASRERAQTNFEIAEAEYREVCVERDEWNELRKAALMQRGIPDAKDAVPGHAQSNPGVLAGVSGAGSGGGTAPNPSTFPPASAGDKPGEAAGLKSGANPTANAGNAAPAASPSEPEPGAPHDWRFDNGDIYCTRCNANHGELVNRPCSPPARAAVPEEPRPAAAPKVEDPPPKWRDDSDPICNAHVLQRVTRPVPETLADDMAECADCGAHREVARLCNESEATRARLAALEEVARAASYFSALDFAPFLELYRALHAALARLKETT